MVIQIYVVRVFAVVYKNAILPIYNSEHGYLVLVIDYVYEVLKRPYSVSVIAVSLIGYNLATIWSKERFFETSPGYLIVLISTLFVQNEKYQFIP